MGEHPLYEEISFRRYQNIRLLFSSRSFSSFSISQMEMTGKNFEKRRMAKMNPAESPAIIDHSTHEGI
jgi:hypothetical protein